MADVFISYARVDNSSGFVNRLHKALTEAGKNTWVDYEDIPYGVDWEVEFLTNVDRADTFVPILSPEYLVRPYCQKELDRAIANNKRILPIVYRDADWDDLRPEVSKINAIFCREGENFETALASLLTTLDTDIDHVRVHTRLLTRAQEWANGQRHTSRLLRGVELHAMERWQAQSAVKDPKPTPLQTEYILASRQGEIARQRLTLLGVSTALVVAIALSILSFGLFRRAETNLSLAEQRGTDVAYQAATSDSNAALAQNNEATAIFERDRANLEAEISRSRELAALSANQLDNQLDTALLLGLEAFNTYETFEARNSLLNAMTYDTRLVKMLADSEDPATSIAISPTGNKFAVGSSDGIIQIYDLSTGEPITRQMGMVWSIKSMVFSPDGESLIAGDSALNVIRWDLQNPLPANWLRTAKLNPDTSASESARLLQISPDMQQMAYPLTTDATGTEDTIVIWDINAHREIRSLSVDMQGVIALTFSPDSRYIAVTGIRDTSARPAISIWELSTGDLIFSEPELGADFGVTGVAFNPMRQEIAVVTSHADSGISLIVWDLEEGQEVSRPFTNTAGTLIGAVTYMPDGERIAVGNQNGVVRMIDLIYGLDSVAPLQAHQGGVNEIVFSADGQSLVSREANGRVSLSAIAGRLPLGQPIDDSRVREKLAFSPDGKILAAVTGDSVTLWDVETGEPIGEPLEQAAHILALAYSPDGSLLASGAEDGQIMLWDTSQLDAGGTVLNGHSEGVYDLAFSPDGKLLASASIDATLRLWDMQTREQAGEPISHPLFAFFSAPFASVTFSPDGKILAAGELQGDITLWDTATREMVGTLAGHDGMVLDMEFSPDGTVLASGAFDFNVILWDVAAQRPRFAPMTGHTNVVSGISFSPDGQMLASSGMLDQSVRLWNVNSGQSIGNALTGHSSFATDAIFSPDGTLLATSGGPPGIILWDFSLDAMKSSACSLANRNLTVSEWQYYIGDRAYEPTCPQSATGLQDFIPYADSLATSGRQDEARTAFTSAVEWAAQTNHSRMNARLCLYGSLDGFAEIVLPACDRAVELEPDTGFRKEFRGLARVLTGNYEGAIEDYQALIDWTLVYDAAFAPLIPDLLIDYRTRHEAWLAELEAGRNPIDEVVLAKLREENQQ
jgi:WD40 repeat protein